MSYTIFKSELEIISSYNIEEVKERNHSAFSISLAIAVFLSWFFADPEYKDLELLTAFVFIVIAVCIGVAVNQWLAARRHAESRKSLIDQIKAESEQAGIDHVAR